VRRATAWSAQFLAPRAAAQRMLPAPLRAVSVAGRAVIAIAVQRYEESDLGAYDEVALSILVRRHDGARGPAVYIRHLPVTQGFTLEAGRTIWGYPKWLADITVTELDGAVRCTVREDGEAPCEIEIRTGGPVRMPQRAVPTYSDAEGRLNLTSWVMNGATRGRIGGAHVTPGTGRLGEDLRALGFPRRAVFATSTPVWRASFGPSSPLG
jgi:Acetoacetate decarboxylase (ADC)